MDLLRRLAIKAGLFVLSLFVILVAQFFLFQIDISCPGFTYNMCWSAHYLPPPPPRQANVSVIIHRITSQVEGAYGFGQPVWIRFLDYLKLMLTGNFGYNVGPSTFQGEVASTISQRLPFTALLAFSVAAVVVIVSLVLGISALAGRARRLSPVPAIAFALAGVGLPLFLFWSLWRTTHPGGPTWLVALFSHLVPAGYVPVGTSAFMKTGTAYYGALFGSMLAPFAEAAAIVFLTALLVRLLYRGSMRFMTALVMVLASSILWVMLLEVVFAWPGLGQALYFSWITFDYPLEQAVVFEMLVIPFAIVFVTWCLEDILVALRALPVTVGRGSGVNQPNQPSSSAPPSPQTRGLNAG